RRPGTTRGRFYSRSQHRLPIKFFGEPALLRGLAIVRHCPIPISPLEDSPFWLFADKVKGERRPERAPGPLVKNRTGTAGSRLAIFLSDGARTRAGRVWFFLPWQIFAPRPSRIPAQDRPWRRHRRTRYVQIPRLRDEELREIETQIRHPNVTNAVRQQNH